MKPAIVPLLKSVVRSVYEQRHKGTTQTIKSIMGEMKKAQERITKGRELLLEGDLWSGEIIK